MRKSWKRGSYPAPVYVGEFDDGTVARISFWSEAGKPFDFESGRRTLATIYSRPEIRHQFNGSRRHTALCESAFKTYAPRVIVDGYVEHDVPGEPWMRVRDPLYAAPAQAVAEIVEMPRRQNWRAVADSARRALETGDAAAALAILQRVA